MMIYNSTHKVSLYKVGSEHGAENESHRLLIPCVAITVLITLFFAVLVITETTSHERRVFESWFIMPIAYLFSLANCIIGLRKCEKFEHRNPALILHPVMVKIGGAGRHEAYLMLQNPEAIRNYLKLMFSVEFTYAISATFPKLAIVLLYLSIFVSKWARTVSRLTGVFIVAHLIVMVAGSFILCRPINFRWDRSRPNGTCIDIPSAYRYINIPNLVSDIILIALPIPTMLKLQVSTFRKVAIYFTLTAGSL